MIVVMTPQATCEQTESARGILRDHGLDPITGSLAGIPVLISEANGTAAAAAVLERAPGVRRVVVVAGAQRLTSRAFRAEDTEVTLGPAAPGSAVGPGSGVGPSGAAGPPGSGGAAVSAVSVVIGGSAFAVIAGPCAVESAAQMNAVADSVIASGACVLRGGAFKPRTSPYSFQGLGSSGLAILAEQRGRTGLPVVTEVVTPGDVEAVARDSDMLQIGTRNMQNFALLREAGLSGRPVLLKRGMSATIEEWLLAAEYVMHTGNSDVVLCERGIRGFERGIRFTLDLSAVAEAKRLTHLPVIVDPSHSTGKPHLVAPMSLAAAACGADGLIVDVHTDAANALCDGGQALSGEQFAALMGRLRPVAEAVGRTLSQAPDDSFALV